MGTKLSTKFIIIPIVFLLLSNLSFAQEQKISINGHVLIVEIADTFEKRETGLMNREKLEQDNGMLFIFAIPHFYGFWMKDTTIPLSLAFIDEHFAIVAIFDLKPLDRNQVLPPKKVPYVLEVNKGWFEKNKIGVGDFVKGIKKKPNIRR